MFFLTSTIWLKLTRAIRNRTVFIVSELLIFVLLELKTALF